MPIVTKLSVVLAVMALSTFAVADDSLLPSEITILTNHAMQTQPGADRNAITTPLVARMQTDDLSELEHFMKGEVHFLHLQPEEARDEFWEFRNREDDLGRVAWQRLMVVRINAFQMVDTLVDQDIPRYEKQFGIRADDRHGVSFPMQRTAQLLADRGDADRALDLIAGYVRKHDQFDAPYTAYALPGQFFSLAAENGRADEFRELNSWVQEGLNAAIAERLENPVVLEKKAVAVPGAVFFSVFADAGLDHYEWTAQFMKMRDRIVAGVATARPRPGQ
jgi:hypothetical protein